MELFLDAVYITAGVLTSLLCCVGVLVIISAITITIFGKKEKD